MTLSSLVMSFASLLVISTFLHLHERYGSDVFFLYSILTAAAAAFVRFYVPETRGVPLSRIDALLKQQTTN